MALSWPLSLLGAKITHYHCVIAVTGYRIAAATEITDAGVEGAANAIGADVNATGVDYVVVHGLQ